MQPKETVIYIPPFIRFCSGGGFSLGLRYCSLFILKDILEISFSTSYAISVAMVFTTGFFINFYFVFNNKDKISQKFFKFIIFSLALNSFDYILSNLLVDKFTISPYILVGFVTVIMFGIKYLVFKTFVFRDS